MITHTNEEIKEETDAGIEKGIDHAEGGWREAALQCLHEACLEMDEFTMNDVRDRLDSVYVTHDNRAWGGIVKTGRRNGWIIATGRSIRSKVGHGVPLQIWRSLLKK